MVSRFHDFTGLEFLDFWLQSIYTYTTVLDSNRAGIMTPTIPDAAEAEVTPKQSQENTLSYKSPPILIVGTHCGDLEEKVGDLIEIIYVWRFICIIMSLNGTSSVYFVLSCSVCLFGWLVVCLFGFLFICLFVC